MTLRFHPSDQYIEVAYGGIVQDIPASSIVRNELNGWRPLHNPDQVVYAMTHDKYHKYPVMPRPFPRGVWNVGSPMERTDKYLAPYFIPTDAEQMLPIWELDDDGGYDHPTDKWILDLGYGLHFSVSNTTLGCIKGHVRRDLEWLVEGIFLEREAGLGVTISA